MPFPCTQRVVPSSARLFRSIQLYTRPRSAKAHRAIGGRVPAAIGEQLSCVTPAEWEKEKRTLMFDVWAELARAAVKTLTMVA